MALSRISLAISAVFGCLLAACVVDAPDDTGAEELGIDTPAESAALTAEGDVSDAVTATEEESNAWCGGNDYCLARCSKTGDTWHVVGHWTKINYGQCTGKGDDFCKNKVLGHRTDSCWGSL